MKTLIISGAILASSLGVITANTSSTNIDFGEALASTIPTSHAVGAPVAGGSCVFYENNGFRGRRLTVRYSGRGPNVSTQLIAGSNFGSRLNNRVSSVRLNGTATALLFDRANQAGAQLGGIVSGNTRALRSAINDRAGSVLCGVIGVIRNNAN